ncbi:efflux RND transporter periplasmic adaptor subunit [Shimwellia pseudoproteus]|uniref:efflux RND transporter periplasmic adaptor subunit n=1 Tax=Shimwellia pseudoproteus TaxID=570012 RepID=UPI0018ECCE9D|nr:efflux RND transporter periplasmic adaptor subunit [Shimwellia pseudoproteus]MBJ3816118.1 efflux RND transporter periplasmic adaptor subunit [Shimwellia pseudoproteus]
MKITVAPASLALLCLFSSLLGLAACHDTAQDTAASAAPEVIVEPVVAAPLTLTSDLPGRAVPFRVAEIRPQVSGIILHRDFTEGRDVKAGQPLYHIDPAPFIAAEAAARAQLSRAEAAASLAQATLSRYRALSGQHYISRQDLDQAGATAHQAQADIDAARAALTAARIDLGHSVITAPLTGRIGLSAITEGALVENGQPTALSTVQQLDPIYIDIIQPGERFLSLQHALASGKLVQQDGHAQVRILMQDGSDYPLTGTLAFSDVTVDQTTGAITLRAIVPNPHHLLLPGMFVRARLIEGTDPGAILVSQKAITRTPRGEATTLVVDNHNKVVLRDLTIGRAVGDRWQVTAGLRPGERVIVEGLQRAVPGSTVTPKTRDVNTPRPTLHPSVQG